MLKFTFNVQGSKIIIVVVQIGAMIIYITIGEELGKKKIR
jgi:hypothetical protein